MSDEGDDGGNRFTRRVVGLLEGGERAVIVAFGDSITAGYAVRRGFTYFWRRALASRYPEASIQLFNEGVSGDTTWDGLARLEWSVLARNPDLVTINFGINDAVMGIGLGEFESNLAEMVDRVIAECRSEVLLLSSQPLETPHYDDLVLDYYRAVEGVAEEMDVGFVDVYGAWMARVGKGTPLGSLILSGLDHPNEEGYRIIAEELMRLF